MEPLVGIKRERIRSRTARDLTRALPRNGKKCANATVDVEPNAFRGKEVGQGVEVVDGTRVNGPLLDLMNNVRG
jgi:hypothetical protein